MHSVAPSTVAGLSDEQLAARAQSGDKSAREALILRHRHLVRSVARAFRRSDFPRDDLLQAGTVGLIVAVDRFDPDRGVGFTNYACALIRGELQHLLRDKGWAVRVPRSLQELGLAAVREREPVTQRLGRPATVTDIATALNEDAAAVAEALDAREAYQTVEIPTDPDADATDAGGWAGSLASVDPGFERAEVDADIAAALRRLPVRLRHVVALRFWNEMTQQMIANEVGVSQMQVSRLLHSALQTLEEVIAE